MIVWYLFRTRLSCGEISLGPGFRYVLVRQRSLLPFRKTKHFSVAEKLLKRKEKSHRGNVCISSVAAWKVRI